MITTDLGLTFVDESTGEVVEASPAAPITVESLMTYAHAKAELDAAQLALAERMLDLQRQDPQAAELAARVNHARMVATSVEASLEAAFTADVRKSLSHGISLDLGFVRVTWPKPASLWKMKAKPEDIVERSPELAKLLGIQKSIGNPSAPRITVRAEKLIGGPR